MTPDEIETEIELARDQLIYGTSFHKIVDGKKVRIAPQDVYFIPTRWSRFKWWLRRVWVFLFVSKGPLRTRRMIR